MKRRSAKAWAIIFFAELLSLIFVASATSADIPEQVLQKQQLMQKAEQAFSLPNSFDERDINTARGKAILLEIATGNASLRESEDTLHTLGFFVLEQNAKQPQPPVEEVKLFSPSIYYNVNLREWYVIGGGRWLQADSYFEDVQPGSEIGGNDAVGIEFLNADKMLSRVSVKYSYGAYANNTGKMAELRNPMRSVPNQGHVFSFRDLLVQTGADSAWRLQGERFAAAVVYASNFADVSHGVPQVYFAHTGTDPYIEDFNFTEKGIKAVFAPNTKAPKRVAGFDNTQYYPERKRSDVLVTIAVRIILLFLLIGIVSLVIFLGRRRKRRKSIDIV